MRSAVSGYDGGAGPGHDGLHIGAESALAQIRMRSCEARCAPMSRGWWAGDLNFDTTEVLDIATMTFTAGPVMGSARLLDRATGLQAHPCRRRG